MAEEEVLPANSGYTRLQRLALKTTTPYTFIRPRNEDQSLGLNRINANAAYNRGWTGDGVTIGYYEIAIDGAHPELSGKVVDNPYAEIEPGSLSNNVIYGHSRRPHSTLSVLQE